MNIKKILVPAFMFLLLGGCNEDFKSVFGFKDFVQWSKPTASVSENASGPIVLTVQLVGGHRTSDLTVEFTVTATNATEDVDFEFPNGKTLVIPANASTASIEFQPIDNEDIFLEERSVTLQLTDADGYPVDLGAESVKISINEDDFWCPRNQLSDAVATETDLGFSTVSVSIEKSLTPDGCLQFDILGGGGSLFGTGNVRYNGVIIVEDSPESTTGSVTDATFLFYALNGDGPYTGSGQAYSMVISNGTYDLETGVLQFDYLFYQGTSLLFPGTLIYE